MMLIASLVLLGTLVAFYVIVQLDPLGVSDLEAPELERHWWGPGSAPSESTANDARLERYTISVTDEKLKDLRRRLKETVYPEPLEGVGFEYGFNEHYLRDVVVSHWLNVYNWTEQQAWLNSFEHWTTRIDGIRVHYVHARPQISKADVKVKVLPLMLVHGWPGSFVEFLEIVPMLTTPRDGIVFDVVCPSIPGYGFSESPRRPGFGQVEAAQMFDTLMHQRLGFQSYYVQGGDWGALIASNMARLFPQRVRGVHVNVVFVNSPSVILKQIVGQYAPWLVGIDATDYKRLYPMSKSLLIMLKESGYLHIQATKPDTVGLGLTNSPAALAAYILEKFATWTNPTVDAAADVLKTNFGLDKLLTNVMVYWQTGSITSSQRFYKEHFSYAQRAYNMDRVPVTVPAAVASFPNEILPVTRLTARHVYRNLVSFTDMPRGGHFAAFEEPRLMADDIHRFVSIVEAPNRK